MAWRIPEETINALRDRVSIVEIVSNYVALKKAGRNYLGLCPFHGEKTPSFTVSDERGLFHCFGCGAGGSVFTFLMQQERLEFREAVEMVAKRVGFQLPTPEVDGRAASERDRLLRLNAWAAKRFSEALWGRDGQGARQYLEKRGVSEEIARRFGLGYAPPAGDLLSAALAGRREAMSAAARLGLVSHNDQSGGYDRFRGRLMFPITDTRGGTIAFGGRALGDVQPKYLNSPESTLFHKGEVLYGLPEARDEIRKRDEAIVVEGYLDALALIQFGIANVVATLGTALTPAHLRVLRRLAKRIVCFFDGDNAGRRAALRGFAVCAEAGTWAHGAFLPDGEDPDSFVRKEGAEAVREVLGRAVPLTEFYFQQARAQAGPGMPERAQVAQETLRIIATVQDPIERDLLLRTASARLGVGEDALRAALRRAPQQRAAGTSQPASSPRPKPLEPRAEFLLLESMVADEGIARTVALQGVIERFCNTDLANAARELVATWEREGQAIPALDRLPAEVAARLREALLADDIGHEQRLQQAEDCVRRIEADAERPLLHAASQELAEASSSGDVERERDLLRRKAEKLREHRRGVS